MRRSTLILSTMVLGLVSSNCGDSDDDQSPYVNAGANGGAGGSGGSTGGSGGSTGGAGGATGGAGGSTAGMAGAVGGNGPLAELPSPKGSTIDTVEALADNEWVNLGSPEADPTFGKARGRSWGGKAFVYASDIRGAFFTGEGVHAYVKPDGYGMDDVWFYDANAHRWICLYPGNHIESFNQRVRDGELLISDDGQLVDQTGQPIPLHTLIHAWGFLAYDSDQRKFAFLAGGGMGRFFMPGEAEVDEGLTLLETQMQGKPDNDFSPWFYDVVTGRFERTTTNAPPDATNGTGYPQFIYLPGKKQYWIGGPYGTGAFDPVAGQWSTVNASGPLPTGYDFGAALDINRNRIYIGGGDETGATTPQETFFMYDIATETWSMPNPTGTFPLRYASNSASVHYDSANDVVLIIKFEEHKVYPYHPDTNAFDAALDIPAEFPAVSYPSHSCFYSADHNAHFCYVATDSEDNGTMWVYRYKNPG